MSRIITKNRDPHIHEFGSNDLVLNTNTGDLFLKANNKLFKIVSRNQFDQTTTDSILKLISEASEVTEEGGQSATLTGFDIGLDGLYSIRTSSPLTGSNVSFHGGIPFDYGQNLPNSPFIKTNGGFDILMDNANQGGSSQDEPLFRVFKGTGIAGVGGSELLKLDNKGNLTVSGSILTSDYDGGNLTIPKLVKIYFDSPSGMHIYSEGTAPGENQIIVAKTNNLRILNQAHGKDIEFGTENASGVAKTPLTLSGSGDATFGNNLTVTGNVSSSGQIIGTIDGGSF